MNKIMQKLKNNKSKMMKSIKAGLGTISLLLVFSVLVVALAYHEENSNLQDDKQDIQQENKELKKENEELKQEINQHVFDENLNNDIKEVIIDNQNKEKAELKSQLEDNKSNSGSNSSNQAVEQNNKNESETNSPNKKLGTFELTAYTAYCDQCSGITYTGIDLRANPSANIVAVDPNVIPLGSKVRIEGMGVYKAADIGGAIDGKRIDIFMPSRDEALQFGRQNLEVTLLQ